MATSQRRWSKELPPHLSDLMNNVNDRAASFIQVFNNREAKMRQIVRELRKIAGDVREMQETTDTFRKAGADTGGIGLGIGLLAAPFTGGASLAAAASAAAGAGGTGAAVVVGTNVTKLKIENKSAKKVEELGKEFIKIVEPLKNDLEEMKTTCEKLEQRAAEDQAKRSLSEMEEFKKILRRVSELRKRTKGVLLVALAVLGTISDMSTLVSFVSVTATPKEDQKLRDSIRQSADQCQKVIDGFDEMKKKLSAFTES